MWWAGGGWVLGTSHNGLRNGGVGVCEPPQLPSFSQPSRQQRGIVQASGSSELSLWKPTLPPRPARALRTWDHSCLGNALCLASGATIPVPVKGADCCFCPLQPLLPLSACGRGLQCAGPARADAGPDHPPHCPPPRVIYPLTVSPGGQRPRFINTYNPISIYCLSIRVRYE